jgi:transcriptional regulator with PAS, ATPase and Fis domain
MADITVIASAAEIADLAREIADGNGDIAVVEARLAAGVAAGREAVARGSRVLVSRGLTYRMLAAALPDVSQVEITPSGFDLLRAVCEASLHPGPAFVVDYPAVLAGVGSIEEILGAAEPAGKIAIEERRGHQAAVKAALAKGAACVIGNQAVVQEAVAAGVAGVPIRSGREAIAQAIFAARQMLELHRLRDLSARQTDIVINAVDYGLVAIDDHGAVTAINSEARRLLAPGTDEEILGRMRRCLAAGRQWTDSVVKLAGAAVVVDYRPIAVGNRTIGAVATLQELSRLQDIEHKTRHELARRGLVARYSFADIESRSPAMREIIAEARRFARFDASLLISGETGVGKEYFAHAIHRASPRHKGPFVAVNCAAIPEAILESELFGYAEGAFTGARKGGKVGLFEQAHRGTIFLDEIGDMSAHLQARLLRILQEHEVYRLGDDRIIPVDIRIIAATNRDLRAMAGEGRFRHDLYHRLDELAIEVPPLRERKSDIADYAAKFIGELNAKYRADVRGLEPAALVRLEEYDWPGNIRELHNVIGRLVALADGPQITAAQVEKVLAARTQEPPPVQSGLRNIEQAAIHAALAKTGGNRQKAAEILGIGRATLWRKLRHHPDNVSK